MSNINFIEVFSSIQGEGKYVGCRQVFLRLAGCNMACAFCDTPASRQPSAVGQIETVAGERLFISVASPIAIDELANYINDLLITPHHSVSITGGEPLCQADKIVELAPLISGKIYLETNGTLPEKLKIVMPYIHIISMDIKMPSTAGRDYWQEHREFLQLAAEKEVFVKIVLSSLTSETEFLRAIELVAAINPSIPVYLQPVSPINNIHGISAEVMLKCQADALTLLKDVRVIPQTHKFMGQM